LQKASPRKKGARLEEATGDYKVVLDEMVAAMNTPTDAETDASKLVTKQPKPAPAP
jgi:hypothetical protein